MIGQYADDRFHHLFLHWFPEQFLREWVASLSRAYELAKVSVHERHAGPEAHDVWGHERRALVEGMMARTAERFGLECSAEAVMEGSSYHRVLRSGPFVVTQCYSDDYRARDAIHRTNLAERSALVLPNILDDPMIVREQPSNDDTVYAILLHGAHPKSRTRVGYVYACFPDADADKYLTKLDLLRHLGVTVSVELPEEDVAEATPMQPRLQPRRKARDGEGA